MGENLVVDCERLHDLMQQFWFSMSPEVTHALLDGRMNMPQYNALVVLAESGEITMGELARRMKVTMGASTNIVDKLVAGDLVTRGRSEEDRRVVRVKLTVAGGAALKERARGFIDYAVGILGEIAPDERETFLTIYGKIVDVGTRN